MRHFYLLLLSALISTGLCAEPLSSTPTPTMDVTGTWQLTGTSLRKDSEIAEEQGEWDFQGDGTLVITSFYKFSRQKGTIDASYRVEDEAVIVQKGTSTPENYKLIELSDHGMLLKGAFGYYHFVR